LLVREVAAEFGDRVNVVVEEYGNAPTATRFGVRRYPVVFVDDVIVARPKDFGFKGADDVGEGRYVPWRETGNQQRFKDDLRRFVDRRLKGETVSGFNASEVSTAADAGDGPATLPALGLTDLNGRPIAPADLEGRVVMIEIWATWCPPCRSTLAWLNEVQRKHGDRVVVLAIAVDSKEEDVRKLMADIKPSYRVAMATPESLQMLGTVAAVPKMLIYDRRGARARVFFGAPPDLHETIAGALAPLIATR
jgi:thiol-disulfide isomerase/thioredoxin